MAKQQSTDEQRPVREMERMMDVELFLETQSNWAEDSPHCLIILHEMFQHAAIEGWKEVEQIVCQGHQQNMPQLNPEVGVPTVQLVGLETTKEELLEMYLEVYKLHRLPRSPPGEPAILEEVMASLPDHPKREGDKTPEASMQPHPGGSQSPRSSAPHRRRNDDSMEQSLATVCAAHQKALAMVATLEEEIERLSQNRNHPQLRARSKSMDCWRLSKERQKRRCHQVCFTDEPDLGQSTDPKTWPGKEGSKGRGSDLQELPELKLTVASFLWGLPETLDNEGEKTPPEPVILDFGLWVPWKAERCETTEWWMELLAVPGKEDTRKLAREVRASFGLPRQLEELGAGEATLQAPLAPPCLHRQKFMPPADLIFACRDIREIPREKVVAYARALQHWVEQNNPPAGGEPHLLAKSILGLREEVKWYLSFTNKEVFWGVALPEKEEEDSPQTGISMDKTKIDRAPEPALEGRAPKLLGWEKVLHPSWPVVATGDIPQPTKTPKQNVGSSQLSQMIPIKLLVSPLRTPTPPQPSPSMQALALVRPPTPPHGFSGVTACLHTPELVEVDLEAPVGAMAIGLVSTPGISSVSSSQIVKDKLMGITYMDTVTTSVGRVTISGPDQEAFPMGPIIEDITNCQ